MSKICWQHEASSSHTKRFDSGAGSSALTTRRLRRRQGRLGDTWFLDEVFVTINGQRQYLWRAVDQDGDLIDILVQPRRDGRAAQRFFRRLLRSQRQEPSRLVTDKLGSYRVAHHNLMPSVSHDTARYANNRAEASYQPTRSAGAADARLQITHPRSAFLACPWSRAESVSLRATPVEGGSSSTASSPISRCVERGDRSVNRDSTPPHHRLHSLS